MKDHRPVTQCLQAEPKERAGAFAFAVYPAALHSYRSAPKVSTTWPSSPHADPVDGGRGHLDRALVRSRTPAHPEDPRIAKALVGLKQARAERAFQFFAWCLVEKLQPAKPAELEREIEACVEVLRNRGLA